MAHGIVGMARHGFRVSRARGGAISGGMQQRAQIIQRQPVRGLARQHFEIRVSGFQGPAHLGEQAGALKSQIDIVRIGCDTFFEIAEERFGRNVRPPTLVGHG